MDPTLVELNRLFRDFRVQFVSLRQRHENRRATCGGKVADLIESNPWCDTACRRQCVHLTNDDEAHDLKNRVIGGWCEAIRAGHHAVLGWRGYRSYFYRTFFNRAMRLRDRDALRTEVEMNTLRSNPESIPSQRLEDLETRLKVRQAVHRIKSETMRQVVILRSDGKDFATIGETLRITEGAARTSYWRAAEQLRDELGESLPG